MSTITDRCGHRGCSDECIDEYDPHIPLIPIKEYEVELTITSIEKGRPDIEVSEEGWKFLDDLYNNPTKEAIEEAKHIKELYKDFDWDKLHEGVPFPMEDDEE